MHDALYSFERTHLDKLRLACQVLLGQAEEPFITDVLETELHGLLDQLERVLLLPDRPATPADSGVPMTGAAPHPVTLSYHAAGIAGIAHLLYLPAGWAWRAQRRCQTGPDAIIVLAMRLP
jgi:hypothetical protein